MAYNLNITDIADELIDSRVFYIINKLKTLKLVFRIEESTVYVVGRFHDLEDYPSKVI